MLKKRIIPCLDIKDGRTVKGINFKEIKDAGDPVELAKAYSDQGADELVFLDISATEEKRKTLSRLVSEIAKEIKIPFTVGGGINTLQDAKMIIEAGADKVSINSAAVKNPQLITEVAKEFGSQCVVVAIDVKKSNNNWYVFIGGGKIETGLKAKDWAEQTEQFGAGEILLTSMDCDGMKNGFDLELTRLISSTVSIPVIASGGAGNAAHFHEVFNETKASAALGASIFHYKEISIGELKEYLQGQKIPIR